MSFRGTLRNDPVIMRGSGIRGATWRGYDDDVYRMRGAGVGSIFSTLYSTVKPLITKALTKGVKASKGSTARGIMKDAKKTAMEAGLNVVSDALSGKNIGDSTKRELKNAKKIMLSKAGGRILDSAKKRARAATQSRQKKARGAGLSKGRKSKGPDLFDG